MAFERLTFTKSWKEPKDFSTYEPDEGKVRADLQLLHDEARDSINRLVDALNAETAAAQLPFVPVEGMTAGTVQQAIEEVFASVQNAAAGQLVNGSVSKEKLEAALLKRIYGGRVWLSMNAPTAQDCPETDFPVGQLWMCPGYTLENLVSDTWEVTGGTVELKNDGWLFTTDGTDNGFIAKQTISMPEAAGQQMMVNLQLGEVSTHLNEVKLFLNGVEIDADEGGCFETETDALGNLELQLYAEWPDEEEGETVEVQILTAVNIQQADETVPESVPCSDWAEVLMKLGSFTEHAFPMTLWMQTASGKWKVIGGSAIPVSCGGTGLSQVNSGELLYGTGGESLARLPAVDQGILQWSEGVPRVLTPDEFAHGNRFLRCVSGEYRGTGGTAEVTVEMNLGQVPKVVFLSSLGEIPETVCLTAGSGSSGEYLLSSGSPIVTYKAWVKLVDDKLVFSHETWGNYGGQMCSLHMNAPDTEYRWLAVCDGTPIEVEEEETEDGGENAA